MTVQHFDVVVLGRSIGTLLAAALLAKRELRVLVLGQGDPAPSYRVEGRPLLRRPFTLLSATSPCFRRILQELAQTQRFRRRTQALDPMFAYLAPTVRFEVPPDMELFAREISREFPEVQQSTAELYATLSEAAGRMDAIFERPAVWPPASLWEKLDTARALSQLPADEDGGAPPLLDRLPPGHPYRAVLEMPVLFSTCLGMTPADLPGLALLRLHSAWARGVHALPGGEAELESFLVERIESCGGLCKLESRASRVLTKHGRVVGVEEASEDTPTSTDAVVTHMTGEELAELCDPGALSKRAQTVWPLVTKIGGRFVTSLVLPESALPPPFAAEAFLDAPSATLPQLHVQRRKLSDLGPLPDHVADKALLTVECLCELGRDVLGLREASLAALEAYIPYLGDNVEVVDSPHDGMPAWLFERRDGKVHRREIERIHLSQRFFGPEPMQKRLRIEPLTSKQLGGEPVRGPVTGTYLVGPSVLPTLGQEGEVLAAWSAAHLVTKRDSSRQKMRRQLWTKIETV